MQGEGSDAMIIGFVLGIAGSAVVALLYGLILGQREEQIRHYLSVRRKGWVRRKYVRTFVGAVRGRAAAANTGLLTILILFIPLVMSVYIWNEASQMARLIESVDGKFQALNSKPGTSERAVPPSIQEWQQTKIRGSRFVTVSRILAGLAMLAVYVGWFIWRPFLIMRQRFAHEIDRFTLRIQGLASKTELAELAIAEANVIDEKTLRDFVEVTRRVAMRHEIPQLVTTFDLWKDWQSI
jgi:hypothetical protein